MSSAQVRPTVTRAALEAFENQSGLPDVSRFLVETGRVVLSDANGLPSPGVRVEGREVSHAQPARS